MAGNVDRTGGIDANHPRRQVSRGSNQGQALQEIAPHFIAHDGLYGGLVSHTAVIAARD